MLLFGGRILQGVKYIVRSLIIAETTRSFPLEELPKRINSLWLCVIFGDLIGTLINMMFVDVDFWVRSLQFTYGNAPSILMMVCCLIKITLLICLSHDLSKEFDLKSQKAAVEDIL